MYEKVATVTVSIEETVSLGQGERGPDRDSYFPNTRTGISKLITVHLFLLLPQARAGLFLSTTLTQNDECIHEIVLHGVPPGPEPLGPLGMALDLLTQLSSQSRHLILFRFLTLF